VSQPVNKIDLSYILLAAFAVLSSWLLHEFAHYVVGTILGNKMVMSLNTVYPVSGHYLHDSDHLRVSAAGPVITMLEAVVIFLVMRKRNKIHLYPFLFVCFYMRLLAMIISLTNINDEARISKALGIGTFNLPLLVNGVLLYLLWKISKQYAFSTKFNLLNLLLIVFFSSIIILADQFFLVVIIN